MTRVLRALGLAAVLALLAGLLGVGTAAADDTEPEPLAGAPAVGACYDLTLKQAYGHFSPEAAGTCARRSTMIVTAVAELPESFDWTTVDWEAKLPAPVVAAIGATCDPAATQLVGSATRRAYTLYEGYWFAPTEEQIAAGARWLSCELALTESTRLLPLPAAGPTKVGRRIPDGIARCAKAVKAVKGGYAAVACSRAHQWRTTYAKQVSGKLNDRTALRAARRTCPRHMESATWLYRTDWVSPTAFVVACSDKTRR